MSPIPVLLALMQVVGGLIGLYAVLGAVTGEGVPSTAVSVVYGVAALLFVVSILAGVFLLLRPALGVMLSLINQVFQLVQFAVGGFLFQYISGFYLAVGFKTGEAGFSFSADFLLFDSDFHIGAPDLGAPAPGVQVFVNLLALLFLFWLLRQRRKLRR